MICQKCNKEAVRFVKGVCSNCYCKEWQQENKERMKLEPHRNRFLQRNIAKKYRLSQKGKNAVVVAVGKYEKSNPEKRLAWNKAMKLEKQKPCEICGTTPTHKHHTDYTKPLEITYLCPLHHKQAHCKVV